MVNFRRPRFRRSIEIYVHHSGFGGSLLVNVLSKSGRNFSGMIDISESSNEPLCYLTSGKHVLLAEFDVPEDYPEDKLAPCVAMAFDSGRATARKRLDIYLSPGKPDATIQARFIADNIRVLFDGEVPISHSDEPEAPLSISRQEA
jgi:hypothetical protein